MPPRPWATRVLLPTIVVLATLVLLAVSAGDALWPAVAVQVAPVVLKRVEASAATGGGGSVIVQAPGWVEADPFPIAVTALADGVVAEMCVLEGATLTAGQVVARLVADDARIAVQQAEARLAAARAELARAEALRRAAQADWDNPVELERRVGEANGALAEKQAELERWPSELTHQEALLELARAEVERVRPLAPQGSASQIELIRVEQQRAAQAAQVEITRGRKPILVAQLAQAAAEAAAARRALELRIADRRMLEEAQADALRAAAAVSAAEADLAEARLRLERMEVRAPSDGVVMTRLGEPGRKLMLGADDPDSATVVKLYSPERLQVRVDIPLADAAQVSVGQAAEITVEVLPQRVFTGRVTRVVHAADVQKNTLQVKVAIDSPSPELKPEMLARARFLAAAGGEGDGPRGGERAFAPAELLMAGHGDAAAVWIADQTTGTAERRSVRTGRRDGEWIEVLEGLTAGDWLIASARDGLQPGQRIRIAGEVDRWR